ncbi:hypothetical protein T484DRAFT_1880634 [Baffinella frigidus]|nr:hypothetical protein T484DRAFT_1880634 [Cryptophyta sp. CCMP2293]
MSVVAQRLLRSAVHSVTRHVRHTSVSAGDGAHGAVKQEPGAGGDVAEEMRLLLQAIACPVTKKPLRYDSARQVLVSDAASLAFPIVNGIPNLKPDAGVPENSSAS